jgi:primosomal protein N' (replication factor Y)
LSSQTRLVAVALPLPLSRSFTYAIPEGLPLPEPGTRVRVPFGERVLTGVVLTGGPEAVAGRMREIVEIVDAEPVCPPELLETAARVADRFFCGTGEVLKSALPARLPASGAIRYRLTEKGALARATASGGERRILDRLESGDAVRVLDLPGQGRERQDLLRELEARGLVRPVAAARLRARRTETAYAIASFEPEEAKAAIGRSRRAGAVLSFLGTLGRPASASEIRVETGAGPEVLRRLAARGLLRPFEQERRSELEAPAPRSGPGFTATAAQQEAIDAISAAIRERRLFAAVLQGVTGSGKTEVYLRAIRTALDAGRGAVWLVPEIALTPVFARELKRQFGDRAAVLHSALSERARADAWDRVRAGEARAVIGPRSAAFAPVADPGLFVVDEEHDGSYKQREAPRYDAREVVALRARWHGSALVYGSATPSMEAYHAARSGRVALLRLPERIASRPLPEVVVVDLRTEPSRPEEKGVPLFSRPLLERLREVFARGEQAILLQPRRGFAPFLLCRDCGHDFRCTRCSIARTVHQKGRVLVCHYCGERVSRPVRCPECGGGVLEAIGAGTERVAERFAEAFPEVSYAVLDRDAARKLGPGAVVEDMLSGRIACLIGTQMVAKGHDFPGVTAVGVLSADTLLHFPDFRSGEKTFQLLAQVAGRAGRGAEPGTVHIQTFHPAHPAIRFATAHDVDAFARSELEFRRAFFYPPYSELAAILVASGDRDRAAEAAEDLGRALGETRGALRLSGPAPAPLERLQSRWRFQLLLRASDRRSLLAALEAAVPERPPAGVQISVDVDPQDLM